MKKWILLKLLMTSWLLFANDLSGDWLFRAPGSENFYKQFSVVLQEHDHYNSGITKIHIEKIDSKYSVKIYDPSDKGDEYVYWDFMTDLSNTDSLEYRNGDYYLHLKYDGSLDEIVWSEGSNYAEVDWGIGKLYRVEKDNRFPTYNGGNGTILEQNTENGIRKTLRKHEQKVLIGDLADGKNKIVYDSYDSNTQQIIHHLEMDDMIDICQYYSIDYIDQDRVDVWLKITTEEIQEGWILFRSGKKYYEPYGNDTWSVLETIDAGGKKWTVRKLEQRLSVWETMNVRDIPGLNGSKVIFQLVAPEGSYTQMNYTVSAITEEKEIIDGRNDHWVKIQDDQGREGWMFAGYSTVERGGPRYYFPENRIDFGLGYY